MKICCMGCGNIMNKKENGYYDCDECHDVAIKVVCERDNKSCANCKNYLYDDTEPTGAPIEECYIGTWEECLTQNYKNFIPMEVTS